jgi:Flp pilus assembly protein TadD
MVGSNSEGAIPASGSRAARRQARLLLGLGLLVVLGLSVGVVWQWWKRHGHGEHSSGAAPAPAFYSPFLNTVAGVNYVGDDACAECHEKYVQRFRRHPMHRSLTAMADWDGRERYDEAAGNPFSALGRLFRVEREKGQVVHQELLPDAGGQVVGAVRAEVQFVVGSGQQGSSYLVEREGFLTQSPISWFAHKGQQGGWDLSPGFGPNHLHFDRTITLQCLFCHATPPAPVEHAVNRYRSPRTDIRPIGCERCHGPGELHVQGRKRFETADRIDYTIVNPRHLEPDLREGVCQQCHLQGEARIVRRGRSVLDYRPGLPLHQYLSIFVRPPEVSRDKAISQVEQMVLSRCFRESKGQLGCSSCHDPHELPAPDERVSFFRDRCLKCHEEKPCRLAPADRLAQSKDDSCIECHLPQGPSRNIAHLSFTDHRVVRHRDRRPVAVESVPTGEIPLLHFHGHLVARSDQDGNRDLALAMIETARSPGPDEVRQQICARALALLDRARRRMPEDLAMAEARGYALWVLNRPQEALAALEQALAEAPSREVALEYAGQVAAELGQLDAAAGYGTRLVEANPWRPQYRVGLAEVLVKQRDWPRALEECRAVLRLDPGSVPARRMLITCLRQQGDKEQARAEFDRLMSLNPSEKEKLKAWFDAQGP